MAKTVLFFLFLSAVGAPRLARSQNSSEWLRQKETELRYLREQLHSLQAFHALQQRGYDVAEKGLSRVQESAQAEHGLHQRFLRSLGEVNPALREGQALAEGRRIVEAILAEFSLLSRADGLSAHDRPYLRQVQGAVARSCSQDWEELLRTCSPGQLELTDGERLRRMQAALLSLRSRLALTRRFARQVRQVVRIRSKSAAEAARVRLLFD